MKNIIFITIALLVSQVKAEPTEIQIEKTDSIEIQSLNLDFEQERNALKEMSPIERITRALINEKQTERAFNISLGDEAKSPTILAKTFN